jgi:polysaccharide deacetylase family protein (PEP-CTERM system associated)
MTQTCLDKESAGTLLPLPAAPAPYISVIVPVRNEARCIRRTLEQLLNQHYDPDRFEVIVSDGQSTDDTRTIVRRMQTAHANLRLLANTRRFSSAGRNLAIRAARGDLVVVVDGHSDLDNPNYLAALADAFARSGADCIGRPQPLDITEATPLQRAIGAARSSCLGHHPASFIYSSEEQFVPPQSVAVAYRRWVFDAVGYFDEDFDACEDVEFNHRLGQAGFRCFFTPRVGARYHPRSSVSALFFQMRRYGQGRMRLMAKHPNTVSLSSLAPAAFLAGLMVGPAVGLFAPSLLAAYASVVGLYVLVVLAASLAIALKGRDWRLLPWLPLVFVTVHCGAGAGLLLEAARHLGRRRWAATRSGLPAEGDDLHGPRSVLPLPTRFNTMVRRDRFRPPFPQRCPEEPVPNRLPLLNALTIDVEDYFQVSGFEHIVDRDQWDKFESRIVGSTDKILHVLDRASVRATFFVLGWVADKHPELVRRIHAAGHEIGCHSYWHRLIYQQTPEEFRADLRRARDLLQDIVGARVRAYRAPSFSVTRQSLWALDILIEEGFNLDSSIYPTHHDRYGIAGAPRWPHQIARPSGTLWEFPMAIYRYLGYPLPIGGGGYFRLYPYAFTRHALRAINDEGKPFAVYLHPWEIDPGQPRLRPGRLRAFRHYVNLHRTEQRLARLVQDFRLGTLSAVHAQLHAQGLLPLWDLTVAA